MKKPADRIKQSQRESILYKEISSLYAEKTVEDPELRDLFITKVELTPDRRIAYIYFYTTHGEDYFKKRFQHLILYKPSMRKAIAERMHSKFTPDLRFYFDRQMSKQIKIEQLLDTVKHDDSDPDSK